jgi:hypothetical protein
MYNTLHSSIRKTKQELGNRKEVSMTPFSLNVALGAPVDAVARMLADGAAVSGNTAPWSKPMKVTMFFGSLMANYVLAVVTVRYRADLIMPMLTT